MVPGGPLVPLSLLQILALSLGVVGVVLGFIAVLTPAWQVVYAREIEQWVQSGLWLNCQTRPNGMYTCAYVFTNSDFDFYTSAELLNMRAPPFYAWQRHLLFVYLGAQLAVFLALFSLCLSFHWPSRRLSAFSFVALMAVAVLAHCSATVTFAFLSQMVEYRFFHVSVSGIYEKHRGYSFFVECAAIFVLFSSLIPALLHLLRLGRADSPPGQQFHSKLQYTRGTTPPTLVTQRDPSEEQQQQWEARFAMRELPPLPPVAGFRWAD
ncbi:hypothetical protein niasHT_027610 [Heterodera trifolii]|uniref:Uncharacterized protein n=1 Tax=Heterodera trifolii TaxID=157864 RepID=A0ABD2K5Q2_9BILA